MIGMSALIAVGVGNTSLQLGFFDGAHSPESIPVPQKQHSVSSRSQDWSGLRAAIPAGVPLNVPWYVASVFHDAAESVRRWVQQQFPESDFVMLRNEDFSIPLDVLQPPCVGTDRVAAAVAVNRLRDPGRPAIFVDAGTAITVNALSPEGHFLGGAILPGTTTSGQALASSTDQLPEIQITADNLPAAMGKDTGQAIRSGIYWGSVGAVKELTARVAAEAGFATPQVFVTGGFGPALASQLGRDAQYNPHLVLSGVAMAARLLPENRR